MKNTTIGIIVVVVLLALAGVGFMVLNNSKDKTATPTPTTSTTQTDTSNMDHSSNSSSSNNKPAATTAVTIENFAFTPATITVKKGATVTWTNKDSTAHTVTADSGTGPNSELLEQGETYSFKFDTAGTFKYHCKPHPNMMGTVIVE